MLWVYYTTPFSFNLLFLHFQRFRLLWALTILAQKAQKYKYKDWILLFCFSYCYEMQRVHL